MADSGNSSPSQSISNVPSVASLVTYEDDVMDVTEVDVAAETPPPHSESDEDADAEEVPAASGEEEEEEEESGEPFDRQISGQDLEISDEEEEHIKNRQRTPSGSKRSAQGGGGKKSKIPHTDSLVSYGFGEDDDEDPDAVVEADEDEEEDESREDDVRRRRSSRTSMKSQSEEDVSAVEVPLAEDNTVLDRNEMSDWLRSLKGVRPEELQLPPLPRAQVSEEEQRAFDEKLEKKTKFRRSINTEIKANKGFRNPSIYEKLVENVKIEERGTNFPPEVFDPHRWTKDAFYEELSKVQTSELQRIEKQRKSGLTASSSTTSLSATGQPERRSKWDNGPANRQALVTHATGTKTAIPAVGSLSKKK